MGRRSRRRQHQAQDRTAAPRSRMARVQVSDETWSAFRAGLGATPASVELGRLVEREVASRRRDAAADAGGVRHAIDDAKIVVDELSAMIARLDALEAGRTVPATGPARSDVLFD